jgi:hypothetical protein
MEREASVDTGLGASGRGSVWTLRRSDDPRPVPSEDFIEENMGYFGWRNGQPLLGRVQGTPLVVRMVSVRLLKTLTGNVHVF